MINAADASRLRHRYMLMAMSVFMLDLSIVLGFNLMSGLWSNSWRTIGMGVIFLLIVNWTVARWLFRPIDDYLNGRLPFAAIQRLLACPAKFAPALHPCMLRPLEPDVTRVAEKAFGN